MNIKQAFIVGMALVPVMGSSTKAEDAEKPRIDSAHNALRSTIFENDSQGVIRTVFCTDGVITYGDGDSLATAAVQPSTEQARANLRKECKAAGLNPEF